MVGRLRAALPVVMLLAAAASPLTAQPPPLLLGPSPLLAAVLEPTDEAAPLIAETLAQGPGSDLREVSVSPRGEPTDAADSSDAAEAGDASDAVEGAPAAAAAPAPTGVAVLRDSGEVGIEYQLSLRDADSFLNRLSAHLKRLVEQAMTYLGTPYRRGGTSRRGLDCSGLVGAVYGGQGLGMPRTAVEQFAEGVPVAASDLRPGDLVFFRDTYKRGISHVGIFVGDGRFLHAAGHRQGVIVSALSRPYYRLRYAGARRLPTDTGLAGLAGIAGAAVVAAADSLRPAATQPVSPGTAARH